MCISRDMVINDYDKILSMKERILKAFEDFPEVIFCYLFGSVTEGTEGPLSDLDIAVYMNPYSGERFIKLHTELCRALKRSDIDLLVLNRTRMRRYSERDNLYTTKPRRSGLSTR